MSKLDDLKAKVTEKLSAVPAEATAYISALEARVSAHKTAWIAAAAIVAVLVLAALVHHLKH